MIGRHANLVGWLRQTVAQTMVKGEALVWLHGRRQRLTQRQKVGRGEKTLGKDPVFWAGYTAGDVPVGIE